MSDEIEDRVRRLEDIAFDGDGLQRSVTRLGMSASALGEALLQVDRNQQTLTKLGSELAEVDAKMVPRKEHEERWRQESQVVLELSRRTQKRTVTIIVGFFLLSCLIFGAALLNQHRLQQRAADEAFANCKASVASAQRAVVFYDQLLQLQGPIFDNKSRAFFVDLKTRSEVASKRVCKKP